MAGRVRKGHGKPGKSWILASELKFKNKVRFSEMEKQFQNQCKITSSWMFFILRFTFAQRCSCSVHIYIFPLVIHWRECVIKIFSQNRRTLIYDERKSRQRNQNRDSLRRKPHKEQRYRTMFLDSHLGIPVVFPSQQNPTMRKGCHEENIQCQNIDACTRNASTRQKM